MLSSNAPIVASQGFEYGVKHFHSPKSGEIINLIAEILEIPNPDVNFLIQLGSVYVNSKRANTSTPIHENDQIRVHTKPRRYKIDCDWSAQIIFDHKDFVVLNKPSGIPSHPSVDNQIENSLTQLSLCLKQPLFITHRLDSLTEGLIVYAKNSLFVNSFNKQLQNRTISKKYVALVETTELLSQHLVHYMEPSPRAPKKVSMVFHENWDLCELKIEQQKILSDHSWIKINLLTGRTHQIRSQCSEVGAPILGDHLYGSRFEYPENKIALRAQEIEFNWLDQRHQIKMDDQF